MNLNIYLDKISAACANIAPPSTTKPPTFHLRRLRIDVYFVKLNYEYIEFEGRQEPKGFSVTAFILFYFVSILNYFNYRMAHINLT